MSLSHQNHKADLTPEDLVRSAVRLSGENLCDFPFIIIQDLYRMHKMCSVLYNIWETGQIKYIISENTIAIWMAIILTCEGEFLLCSALPLSRVQ